MPEVDGCRPDMRAVREGLQTGAAHWALANLTPRRARRSRLGVTGCGAILVRPAKLFWSSRMMSRTLGGGFDGGAESAPDAAPLNAGKPQSKTSRVTRRFMV